MIARDYRRARRKKYEKRRRYQECSHHRRHELNKLKQYYADPTNDPLGLLEEELTELIPGSIRLDSFY